MEQVMSTGRIPVKIWTNYVEEGALKQAQNLSNLPFAFKQVCLMPDTHEGYGMPIGGVLATQGVIIPNAVGVDIGCGMCAVKTNIRVEEHSLEEMKKIMGLIRSLIPVGFDHHKKAQDETLMPQVDIEKLKVVKNQYKAAIKQLGTLGGGNHFIELQRCNDGFLWMMIHSGSRNLGKQVADYYNNIAKKLNALWCSSIDPKHDLAFLPFETPEAKNYYQEMRYCTEFAFASRKLMMERVQEAIRGVVSEVEFEPLINIAHNYASWEEHFGEKVLIHRKGATSARLEEIGIIPGSQGTKSYIVEGLGNQESFMSCSHGAGRVMSRSKALKTLNLEEEQAKLDALGILHSIRGKHDLEEASSAYKNIDEVMEFQKDLVKIKVELSPLGVIKG